MPPGTTCSQEERQEKRKKEKEGLTNGSRRHKYGGGRGGYPVADDARRRHGVQAVGAVDHDGAGAAGLGPARAGDRTAADPPALTAVFGAAEEL